MPLGDPDYASVSVGVVDAHGGVLAIHQSFGICR
jgi:hypothetical protein